MQLDLGRRVPALLWLAAAIGLAAGVAQLVTGTHEPGELIADIEYLVDADHNLTLNQVLADEQSWQQAGSVPNFGFREEAHWFRITVQHTAGEPADRLLELSYPILDDVRLYVLHGDQLISKAEVGDDLGFHDRPIRHRNFVFPLVLQPGETTVILRIATQGVIQAPLTLWQPIDFIEFYEAQSIIDGAYFGVMVIMVFYNLILYLGIREKPYLYYVGHVGTATLFLATMHGLAYMHLWPEQVWWQSRAVPVLVSLSVVFISLFVTAFLKIESRSPSGRLFTGLLSVALLWTGLSMVLDYAVALRVASLLSVLALVASLTVSISGWVRGNRSARFLVLAWGAFVAGSVALAMNKLGVLPRTPFTESGMLFGSMLDVVLLSIAMADRVRQERLMREEAQRHAMDMEKKARVRLEDAVADRTEQLEQAMEQLREANLRLEALSNLDGLTGVNNRRYFDQALEFAYLEAEQQGSPLSLLLVDADHFKRINDTHGHLCGDEVLRTIVRVIAECASEYDNVLARIGGEEFVLLLPGIDVQGARVLSERIRQAIETMEVSFEGAVVQVTASIGISHHRPGRGDAESLFGRADRALYQAKQSGRNRSFADGDPV